MITAEANKTAELLKKSKKKPKTIDEETNDRKEILNRVTTSMSTHFVDFEIDKCEAEIELLKTEWLMQNHIKMNADVFE